MAFVRSITALAFVLVAFSSAFAKAYVEKAEKDFCYAKDARCAGAEGHPYVKFARCCDEGYFCLKDANLGWGRFCKKPSEDYWQKCYIKGARCEGAPGKPYVDYHKCCGTAECVKDKSMGWGKFCKVTEEEQKYEVVYKEVIETAKEEKVYDDEKKVVKYRGTFYESADGKLKYRSYKDDKEIVFKAPIPKKKKPYVPKVDYGTGYGSNYGTLVKGRGSFGKDKIEKGVCSLGGGSAASCVDVVPSASGYAIYYLTIHVPYCKGGLPCNAARAILKKICNHFSFATGRKCYFTGVLFGSRMAVLDRQLEGPPIGNALGGSFPTASMTTTTTAAAATAGGVAKGSKMPAAGKGSKITGQVHIPCDYYTATVEALADKAAKHVSTYVKVKAQCEVPSPSP